MDYAPMTTQLSMFDSPMLYIPSAIIITRAPGRHCSRCGRRLSNPVSMAAHKGPVCRAKTKPVTAHAGGATLNLQAALAALIAD